MIFDKKLHREMVNRFFRNRKTRNIYVVESVVWDATNATDGRAMVVYRLWEQVPDNSFVRDYDEFMVKFEQMESK